METHEETLRSYLRGEVEAAGVRYDSAIDDVFRLLDTSAGRPGPELLSAVRSAKENLRLYSGAIRRMAHVVARP